MMTRFTLPARRILSALLKGDERLLFLVFLIPFCAKLLENLIYSFSLLGRPLDFSESYAATEWLINYSSGFIRRGLQGEIVHGLYQNLAIQPFSSIVLLSVLAYFAYALWAWRLSRGLIPGWALLTTPLLGYPVYVEKIFLRKDILILLMLMIAILLVTKFQSWWSDLAACLMLAVLVMSHEVGAFLAIVPTALLMLLRETVASNREHDAALSDNRRVGMRDATDALKRACKSLIWLILPIISFVLVTIHHGTKVMAVAIASSWKSAYDPVKKFPGPSGAIAWLGSSLNSDAIPQTQAALNQRYLGIPYWCILVMVVAAGIALIYLAFASRSKEVAWFFACFSLVQFICISPLFFVALDHVRWIVFSLNSAFLFTVMTPGSWREAMCRAFPPPSVSTNWIPACVAPIGLAFWGLQLGPWSPYSWLSSAPIGLILQIYFYLRVIGLLPDVAK